MADYEEAVAREVHALLLSAMPGKRLTKTWRAQLNGRPSSRTPRHAGATILGAGAYSAIQDFRNAIVEGASHSERKRRLRHAENCAHGWLNARRFPNPY